MKTLAKTVLICMLFGTGIPGHAQGDPAKPDRVLRHVVLFAFKEGTPDSKIAEIVQALEALPSKIPEIKGFEWGLNNSPEGLNKGFTHSFTLTFASEEGRDIYLPHPDHQAFGEVAGPHIADVLVVDYWAAAQ
jgi:hypothetical protein